MPLFTAKQSCNSKCRCRDASSYPYIWTKTRCPDESCIVHKRKRDRHDSQDYPLKGKKSAKFMYKVSEQVTTGSMSNFEYLLVHLYTIQWCI